MKSTSGLGSFFFKEIFEAAPEFLAKELRKLRVTRAIAARIKSEIGIQLRYSQLPGVFFVSSLLLEFTRPTRFWGCCDEIRLSVEFVTVGDLGICRHSCD